MRLADKRDEALRAQVSRRSLELERFDKTRLLPVRRAPVVPAIDAGASR